MEKIQELHIMQNRKHKTTNDAFILMVLYFSVFFLIIDFGISVPLTVVIFTILEMFITLITLKQYRINKNVITPYFFIVLLILFNLRPNGYINEQPFYLFTMLMFLFIIPLSKPSDKDRDIVISILVFVSVCVSSLIIISKLSNQLFSVIYLNHITYTAREYNYLIRSQGYSGVVGSEAGITGMYIIVGLSIIFSKLMYKKTKKDYLLFAILFTALLLLGRRSELLIFLLSFLLFFYMQTSKRKKMILLLCGMMFIICLFVCGYLAYFGLISYYGNNRIISSFFAFINGADISNGRSVLYKATWQSIKQHFLFGIGWGGVRKFIRLIIPFDVNVHNIYLQLLCEIGIIGALFFIILFSNIIKKEYLLFCKCKGDCKKVYITTAFFLSIYLIFFGLLNNPIYVDYFWFIVSIIFFLSNNLYDRTE